MKQLLPAIVLISLLGAGCAPATPNVPSTGGQPKPAPVATKLGFGKLPGLQPYGSLGTAEAMSSRSSGAVGLSAIAPNSAVPTPTVTWEAVESDAAVSSPNVGGGTTGVRIMPAPDMKPVNVKYAVSATMPDWQSEAQVLHVRRPNVDSSIVRSLAVPAGLPSALAGQVKQMQSVSMSWMDNEDFQWNFDPIYGNLNWWKQYDPRIAMDLNAERMPEQGGNPPALDKARAIAAADAFLNSHGLSALREQGAIVDETPWTGSATMPCILKEEEVKARDAEATSLIYPGPCGWYPTEVTVFYGAELEGLPTVDAGGYPFRMSSVQVSLSDYSVRSGNVMMAQDLERSAYPLISKDEAMKRLQEGGRNPVYSWGGEEGDVEVKITKAELAWMRFDSWANNKQESYYLPALAAEGTVDRKMKGQEPEVYRTVVPLVADSAFDLDQGGGGVPVPLMMGAPAATTPAAPVTEPVKR
ncbi:hypothetical protein M0Q28_00700 [Patescibacteria group bacterium]|jgi:hypothetical protein|nr:hypothetical protein [Patescibacteria group bacterium]